MKKIGTPYLFWVWLALMLPSPGSLAAEAPKLKEPAYPLEPDKKPSQKISPDEYIEGPDTPPDQQMEKIPRVARYGKWWASLDLGWEYVNQSADQYFTGVTLSAFHVHRVNNNVLGARVRAELGVPWIPLSWALGFSGTSGTAQAITPTGGAIGSASLGVQDLRVQTGPRFALFSGHGLGELKLGVDAGYIQSSYATLTATQDALDVDSRQLMTATPRLDYCYCIDPNWGMELRLGVPLLLSGQGARGLTAGSFTSYDGDLSVFRYFSHGSALGIGGSFNYEKALWTTSAPVAFADQESTTDLRLNLFWRMDF